MRLVTLMACLAASVIPTGAQTRFGYTPIEPINGKTPAVTVQHPKSRAALLDAAIPTKLYTYVAPGLSCSPAPTANDLENAGFEFYYSFITAQEAANLKLPFGSLGGGGSSAYLLEDMVYQLPCTATDGKTILTYGFGFRSLLSIDNWNASLSVSYAVVAADATLNHHGVKFGAKLIGMRNTSFPATITAPALKDFNVDTLVDYRKAQSDIFSKIDDPATTKTPQILGSVSLVDSTSLIKATALSFALTRIVDGKSCNDTINAYYDSAAVYPRQAIGDAYATVLGITKCDDTMPNDDQKSKAQTLLAGLKTVKAAD